MSSVLLPRIAALAQASALKIDELIFDVGVAGQADRHLWNYDRGRPHGYDNATLNRHNDHIQLSVID